jgi:hypothetical protein
VKESAKRIGVAKLAPTICDVPVLGSAMLREASWSRSNTFWDTFGFKRQSTTLGANSGFDQPSMITLASSLILELGVELRKGCRLSISIQHTSASQPLVCGSIATVIGTDNSSP